MVSEETGSISVVADGQIERGLDADALRARLRSLRAAAPAAVAQAAPTVAVPDDAILAVPPFGLKLLSLALAVMLWMVVAGEETVERGLRVPLELQQFPAGLELQGEAPSTRRRARARRFRRARPRSPGRHRGRARPAHGASAGRRLFQLTPEQVRVPFGVRSSR